MTWLKAKKTTYDDLKHPHKLRRHVYEVQLSHFVRGETHRRHATVLVACMSVSQAIQCAAEQYEEADVSQVIRRTCDRDVFILVEEPQ